MNLTTITRYLCLAALLMAAQFPVAAQDGFTNSAIIKSFLHDNLDGKNVGMVIGLVDAQGSRIFGAGKLDNGTSQEVDGDTLFEIGSATKTFTTLLLQDMVERGEMRLEDLLAKYLPETVKLPTQNKAITLLDLATHTSGLPRDVPNTASGNPNNPFDYTAQQLYTFLASCSLASEPGVNFKYSNVGMGLLGHAIALKAGKDYESLVRDRICLPLHMDSTCATLTPELKGRLASGHNQAGKRVANYDFPAQAMAGCGALRSTARDMLKYVSANIGLLPSRLTPLMEKTHQIRHRNSPGYGNTGMDWMDRGEVYPPNMELLGHAGGTEGYHAFIGFDKKQRRGVVVLCNQLGGIPAEAVGWLLLQGVQLTPQIVAGLSPVTTGEFVGVGIKLEIDSESHALRIIGIVPNTPAFEANLSAGLIVQKIDDFLTQGKSVAESAAHIRGKAGTTVRLQLVKLDRHETNTVELTRRAFKSPPPS